MSVSRLGLVERLGPVLSAKAKRTAKAIGGTAEQQKNISNVIIDTSLESFYPPSPQEKALFKLQEQKAGLPPVPPSERSTGRGRSGIRDVGMQDIGDNSFLSSASDTDDPTPWQGTAPEPDDMTMATAYGTTNLVSRSEAIKSYLEFEEGRETVAYSLYDANKPSTWKSGITVGIGYDIGQHSESEIKALNVNDEIKNLLLPYAGLTGKAAYKSLSLSSLELTEDQTDELDDALAEQMQEAMRAAWDESSSFSFDDLTWEQEAVIGSLWHQRGSAGFPSTLGKALDGDWDAVIAELRDDGAWADSEETGARNARAADLLESSVGFDQSSYLDAVDATAQIPGVNASSLENKGVRSFSQISTAIVKETAVSLMVQSMIDGINNAVSNPIEGVNVAGPIPDVMIQKLNTVPEEGREAVIRAAMLSALNPPPTREDIVDYIQQPFGEESPGPMYTDGFDSVNINTLPLDILYSDMFPMSSSDVGGVPMHIVQQMDETEAWNNSTVEAFNSSNRKTQGPLSFDERSQSALNLSPSLLEAVRKKFPSIGSLEIIDSTEGGMTDGRQLETYHPNGDSPLGDVPVVEVFNPDLSDEELIDLIAAEYMHILPNISEEFKEIKERMRLSMNPEQTAANEEAYRRAVENGETRPYEKWFDVSRLDQYMGSGLLPEGESRDGWNSFLTEEQKGIAQEAIDFLGERKTIPGAPHTGSNVDFELEKVSGIFDDVYKGGETFGGEKFGGMTNEDVDSFFSDLDSWFTDFLSVPSVSSSMIDVISTAEDRPAPIEINEGVGTVNIFGELFSFDVPGREAAEVRNAARVEEVNRQINIQRWDEMSSRDTTFGRSPLPVEIKAAADTGMLDHTYGMNIDRLQDREGNIRGDMMERINPANPSEKVDVTTFMLQDGGPERPSMPDYSEDTDAFIADAGASADTNETLIDLEYMVSQREALGLMSRDEFLSYTGAVYGISDSYRLDQQLMLNAAGYVPRPWYDEEKPSDTFWNMWGFFTSDGALLTDIEKANDAMGPLRVVLRALERQKGQGGGFGNR